MNKYDDYEKKIIESYENDHWVSVDNIEEKKKEYAEYAKNSFLKKSIHIRLSERDFMDIKSKSLEEGVSYQVLIESIVHKYISGKLVEKV